MSDVRGRPFAPGNKIGRGRPPGSRNKATIPLDESLQEHGKALLTKVVVMAMQGDTTALRLCLERLLPVRRQTSVKFRLPKILTAADVGKGIESVVQAIADGKLSPGDGQTIAGVLESRGRAFEREEWERRVEALERQKTEEDKT